MISRCRESSPWLCYCSHCNDKVSIGRHVSYLKKLNFNCECRLMIGGEMGGISICASLGLLLEAPAPTCFSALSPCHGFFVRVSCEFAGITCCNLHADYAGGFTLEASMVKRAIRESRAGNWLNVSKMTSATIDRVGKCFWSVLTVLIVLTYSQMFIHEA